MRKHLLAAAGIGLTLAALASAPAFADEWDMRVDGRNMSFGIDIGTPALPPVQVLPAPQPVRVWVPGYWAWDGYRNVWVEGRWVLQPPTVVYARPAPAWSFGWRDEERERHHHHHHEGWR